MLGNKEKVSFGSSSTTTLISKDTEVVGDIKFSGNLDIEGVVRGNIHAQSGKDAIVRIVDKGRVEGEIRAPSVVINGAIVGDVYASLHLELAANAKVRGNVHYNQVEMAIGAEVNGSLKHSTDQTSKEPAREAPKEPARDAAKVERKQPAPAPMQDSAASVKS